MSSDPWEDLARTALKLADAIEAVRADVDGSFAASSPAGMDAASDTLGGEWGPHPVRDTYLHSLHLLAVSLDHLRAMAALLKAPGVIFACSTVARGTLETAAVANYLVDPSAGARERVRRHMNLRLASYHEQAKMVEAPDQPGSRSSSGRLARAGTAHGFQHRTPKGNNAPYFEPGPPKSIDLIAALMDSPGSDLGKFYWRHLSSVAHGQTHGFRPFILPILGQEVVHGDLAAEIGESAQGAARKLYGAPLAVMELTRRMAPQFGWNWEPIRAANTGVLHTWMRIAEVPWTPRRR